MFTSIACIGTPYNIPREAVLTPTHENGYMMLEMDYYNTNETYDEIFENPMDSYVQYDAGFDFSTETAVHLVFEQANRFCCEYAAESNAWFEVSIDGGTTWSRQIVSEGEINKGVSSFGQESYTTEIDVTTMVAGHSDVKFRWHVKGLTHYWWIIDDVTFVVPQNCDIKFFDYWNDYLEYNEHVSSPEDFNEGFYEYPWFLTQAYKGFHAAYLNFGGEIQNNFIHKVDVYKDGELYTSFSSDSLAELPVGYQDTTNFTIDFWPEQKGDYTIVHYPETDDIEGRPENDTLKRRFKIGDSLIKVCDFDETNSYISPDNWENFDENGDGLGFLVNLPDPSLHDFDGNPDYYIVDGIMVYIAANSDEELVLFENGSAKVVAGLYKYDSETDTYSQIITSAEITLSVDDTSSIKYIPFIKNGLSEYLIEGGDYLVTINMYGTWYDAGDRLQSWNVCNANNSVQKSSPQSGVTINATIETSNDVDCIFESPAFALDLDYSYPIISTRDLNRYIVTIYPNPSNGRFTISGEGEYNAQIVDVSGKVVYESKIAETETINLQAFGKGVYFVKLIQNQNSITKTVVIN
jgi:hypothetical protein